MTARTTWYAALILTAAGSLGAALAHAQPGPCRGAGMPRYDPAREETLEVSVEAVEKIEGCCPRGATGTHLKVKAGAQAFEVHLGPSDFLAREKFALENGDALEITGARATCGDEQVILARVVKKGERSLVLRDERGVPVWAGGRRRRGA